MLLLVLVKHWSKLSPLRFYSHTQILSDSPRLLNPRTQITKPWLSI